LPTEQYRPHQHRTDRPAPDVIDSVRRRIRHVIAAGTPAQRKELIEAMVAEIRIDGDAVYPVFLLPGQDDEAGSDLESTGAEERPVRTLVRSVGQVGLEPTT
jgi:hypothetical protein